jgi:hypothetical protein
MGLVLKDLRVWQDSVALSAEVRSNPDVPYSEGCWD